MSSQDKTGRVLPEPQQVSEVLTMVMGKVGKGLKGLEVRTAKYWPGHGNNPRLQKAVNALCQVLLAGSGSYKDLFATWEEFYREVFGFTIRQPKIFPEAGSEFGWIVFSSGRLTPQAVFEVCEKRFPSYSCENLDSPCVSVRDLRTYVIAVRDIVEANETRDLTLRPHADGMTVKERMLLELWYHWLTGEHLDNSSLTICSGSRTEKGQTFRAGWHGNAELGGPKFKIAFADVLCVRYGPDRSQWRVRDVVPL